MLGSAPLDLALLVLPAVSLGLLVTAHVAIVARLATRAPRWRAAAAFFVPPLALVWGFRESMKGWCRVWLGAGVVYLVSVALAFVS